MNTKSTITAILLIVGFAFGFFYLDISGNVHRLDSSMDVKKIQKPSDENELKICQEKLRSRDTIIVLPDFIKQDLSTYGISSQNLNDNQWKKFLELYIKKNAISLEQNKKTFSWVTKFFKKRNAPTLEEINQLIEQGYDLLKKDSGGHGSSFVATYVLLMKTYDKEVIDRFLQLGDAFENNKKYDAGSMNGVIAFIFVNQNHEAVHKLVNHLDSKGIKTLSQNYGFIVAAVRNSKYRDEYYQKMLDRVDENSYVKAHKKLFLSMIKNNANSDTIDKILEKNPQVSTDKNKINVLHYASENKNISPKNYQRFIDLGANINARDEEDGKTPLMKAVENKRIDQVQILLKNRANTYLKDKNGNNVDDYINKMSNGSVKEKIKKLLSKKQT